MITVGGVMSILFTVTLRYVLAVLPAAFDTTALITCLPLALVVVSHEYEYGEDLSVATGFPSKDMTTEVICTRSEAATWMDTAPERDVPLTGEVMATVGTLSLGAAVVECKCTIAPPGVRRGAA